MSTCVGGAGGRPCPGSVSLSCVFLSANSPFVQQVTVRFTLPLYPTTFPSTPSPNPTQPIPAPPHPHPAPVRSSSAAYVEECLQFRRPLPLQEHQKEEDPRRAFEEPTDTPLWVASWQMLKPRSSIQAGGASFSSAFVPLPLVSTAAARSVSTVLQLCRRNQTFCQNNPAYSRG